LRGGDDYNLVIPRRTDLACGKIDWKSIIEILKGGEEIMKKETPRLWIRKREEELELLKKEIETGMPAIKKLRVEIANYIEEIEFIGGLQSREVGLYEAKSGEKQLIEMKKELARKTNSLKKALKEFEEKITRSKNLNTYIGLAHREW